MAYLSHDAWEAQLQHKAPRAILDSYNRGYDVSGGERAASSAPAALGAPAALTRRPTPVSPLEEADAQFERRATVKAAHAMKQDLEDMLRSGLKVAETRAARKRPPTT